MSLSICPLRAFLPLTTTVTDHTHQLLFFVGSEIALANMGDPGCAPTVGMGSFLRYPDLVDPSLQWCVPRLAVATPVLLPRFCQQ